MKILKYNLCTRVNYGTEEEPIYEDVLSAVEMGWNEANEEIARAEADNGVYEIYDDGQPEPSPAEDSVWDELDAAYTEGYEEGYTEGVNTAYDQ